MDNKLGYQLLVIQNTVDNNRQAYADKMKTYDSKLDKLTEMIWKYNGSE